MKAKERLTAPRKVYAIDTGLINSITIKTSQDVGLLYENLVAIELKRRVAQDENLELFYWLDNSGYEIDFLIKRANKILQLIQVCFDINNYDTLKRETRSLVKNAKQLRCKNLIIINSNVEKVEKIEGEKIVFIPLWKWLLNDTIFF
jgi:hypothetical protein